MGDPKKLRKKYETPSHPWIKSRIDDEKKITKEFGTRNKKEIWKMESILKGFKSQAKKLISLHSDQAIVETKHLFRRVQEIGLIKTDVSFDKILGLKIEDLMARRLQSVVFTKGLAKTVNQARQFIVHGHILVDGKKITSPSHIVSQKEESGLSFAVSSSLISEDHPERASKEKLAEALAEKNLAEKKLAEEASKKAAEDAKKSEEAKNKEKTETKESKEPKVEEEVKKEEKAEEKSKDNKEASK